MDNENYIGYLALEIFDDGFKVRSKCCTPDNFVNPNIRPG